MDDFEGGGGAREAEDFVATRDGLGEVDDGGEEGGEEGEEGGEGGCAGGHDSGERLASPTEGEEKQGGGGGKFEKPAIGIFLMLVALFC